MIAMNISGAAAPTGKTAAHAAADNAADPGDLGFAAAMGPDAQPDTAARTRTDPQLARAIASAARPETPVPDGDLPKAVHRARDDPGTLTEVIPEGGAPGAEFCLASAPVRPAPEIAAEPQNAGPGLDALPNQPAENQTMVATNGPLKAPADKSKPVPDPAIKAAVTGRHQAAQSGPAPLAQSAIPTPAAPLAIPVQDGDVNPIEQADPKPVDGPETPLRRTYPGFEPQPILPDPVQFVASATIGAQLARQTVPAPASGPYPVSDLREPVVPTLTIGAATVPLFEAGGEAAQAANNVTPFSSVAATTPNKSVAVPPHQAAPVAISAGDVATDRSEPRAVPGAPGLVGPAPHQDLTVPDRPSRHTVSLLPVDAPRSRAGGRNPDTGAPAGAAGAAGIAEANVPLPTVAQRLQSFTSVATTARQGSELSGSSTGRASETADAAVADARPVAQPQPDRSLAATSRSQPAPQVPVSPRPTEKSAPPLENRQPNWPTSDQNRPPAGPFSVGHRLSYPGTQRLAASPWSGVKPGGEPTSALTGQKIAALPDPLTAAPKVIPGSKPFGADFPMPVLAALSSDPDPSVVKPPAAPIESQTVATPLAVGAPLGDRMQIHSPDIALDPRSTALVGAGINVASPSGLGIQSEKTAGNLAPVDQPQPAKPYVPAVQTASPSDQSPGYWSAGDPRAPREASLAPVARHHLEQAVLTRPTTRIAAFVPTQFEPRLGTTTRNVSQVTSAQADQPAEHPPATPVAVRAALSGQHLHPKPPTPTLAPQSGVAVLGNLPPAQDLPPTRDSGATRHPREVRGPQVRPVLEDRPGLAFGAMAAVQRSASSSAHSPALADPAHRPEPPPQVRSVPESPANPDLSGHRGPGPDNRPNPAPLTGSEPGIALAVRPVSDPGPQQPPRALNPAMPSRALPTDAPHTPESRPTPRPRPEQPGLSRPRLQTAEVSADPPSPDAKRPEPTRTDPRALQINPPREDALPPAKDLAVQNVVPPVAMPVGLPGKETITSDTQPAPAFDTSPQQTHDLPRHLPAALAKAASGVDKDDRVELLLDPVELGKVRFELSSSADRVQVNVSVERPETLDLLRRNIETLRAEFRDAGFEAATLSFSQWGKGGDPAPQTPFARPDLFAEPPENAAPLTPQPARNTSRHGLDLRL